MEKLMEIVSICLWVILLVGLPIVGLSLLVSKYQIFPERKSEKILVIQSGGRVAAIIPEIKGWRFDSSKGRAGEIVREKDVASGVWQYWLMILNSLFGRYGPVIPPFRKVAKLKIFLPKWKSEGDKKVIEKFTTEPTATCPFFVETPFVFEDVETKGGLPTRVRATLLANVLDPVTFLYLVGEEWYTTVQTLIQELVSVTIPTMKFENVPKRWASRMQIALAVGSEKANTILERIGLGNLELRFEGIDPSGAQAEAVRTATIANTLAERQGEAKITEAQKAEKAATHEAGAIKAKGGAMVAVANSLADAANDSPHRTAVIVANQQQLGAANTKSTVYAPGGGGTSVAVSVPSK